MRTATRWLGFVGMIFVLLGAPTVAKGPAASASPKAQGPKTTTSKASTGASAKTPKVKASGASAKTSTSKGATTTLASSTTPKGNSGSAKTKGGKTTTSTQAGATSTSNTTTSNTTSTSTGGATTSTAPTGTWTPDADNAVATKLSTKSNLMQKAQRVIGADVDLNDATLGFKNFGQFVAAVNVANNQNIAFADLKAAMTGIDITGQRLTTTSANGTTTAAPTMSLGQAIQKYKGVSSVESEKVAQTALTQANVEINNSPTTTSTTTTTTTTTTTK